MKKNIIISLFLILGTTSLMAQDSLLNKLGSFLVAEKNNNNHIFQAIESGIYLIRSEYVLKSKTGLELGKSRYKNQYFGYQYAIAMSGKNQLWIPPSVLEPWRHDSAYKDYGDSVKPVVKNVLVRAVNDSSAAFVKMDFAKIKHSDKWNFLRTDALDSTKNLTMSKDLPTTSCWLLSFYMDDKEKFKSLMTSVTPVWDKSKIATIKQPFLAPKGKLVGGVLLKENVSFGKITVELVGLYIFDGNDWILQAPAENQLNDQIGPVPNDIETNGKLKPKGGKPKKEEKPKKIEAPKKADMPKGLGDKLGINNPKNEEKDNNKLNQNQ